MVQFVHLHSWFNRKLSVAEKPKTSERRPKELQRHAGEEGCHGGIDDVSPGKMSRVLECEQLVAVEPVLIVGHGVNEDVGERQECERAEITSRVGSLEMVP